MEFEVENIIVEEIRLVWTDAAVKCLLAFCSANMQNVGKTFALKSKAKLWQRCVEVLAAEGFEVSPVQIETKFRSLERQYKKRLLNNKLTGRNRITCPYEKELDDIFQKKKGVNPEFVLGVEATEAQNTNLNLLQNPDSPMQSSSSHTSPAVSPAMQEDTPKRKKSSAHEKTVLVLEQMAEDRKKEHSELMAFLNQKEENRERRAKEREQLLLNMLNKK